MKTAETTLAIEADNYTGRKNKHIPTATNSCISIPRHYTYTPLKISIHWSWIKINFTTLPTLEINSCDTTRDTEPLSRLSGAAQRTTVDFAACSSRRERNSAPTYPGGPARTPYPRTVLQKDNQPCLCTERRNIHSYISVVPTRKERTANTAFEIM